jgi:spoIIIJ-associated protein
VEWVEASGKSLVEAKETVLDLLGVAEDDAEFIVISEPKPGLFGRLRGEARVQARVRPIAPPPKRARRQRTDRKRDGGDRSRSGGSRAKSGPGRNERNGDSADRSGQNTPVGGISNGGDAGEVAATGAPEGSGPDADENGAASSSTGRSSRRRRGSRTGGGAGGNGQSNQQGKQVSGRKSGESEDTMEESLTLEQQGEAAQGFLSGLVREFGLDAEVSFAEIDEDTVQVAATGDDLGLLVGPRGATLAAVQDLTRTFVQRQSENRTDRILVDVGGYREKRNAALRRFTEGIVHEVKTSGEERALEPMSPADRKVIHDTVNEIDGVETRSDGVEPSRYVVIQPVG